MKKRYKFSIPDKWYIVPSLWTPDAFFLRRNNLYSKYVFNRCNFVFTDTMHHINFNDGVIAEIVLLSHYNSIYFAFTGICRRRYSGSVLEILPDEIVNIMPPIVSNIDDELRKNL